MSPRPARSVSVVWIVPLAAAALLASAPLARPVGAAEPASPALPPIKALLVTGGCCHDYSRQKLILSQGVSLRTDVEWTIAHQGGTATNSKIPLYENPAWADPFDVVVHNECFSDVKDVEWVERILKPHREGKPAVLIHCAMHCYRAGTDKWFEFVGMQSPGHGPHYAFTIENKQADHPIMQGFGDSWTVPKGELYHSVKLWDTADVLATAKRRDNQEPQVCVWTNRYHGARVFATTVGHYNETMAEPEYLDLVTRGLLWSVDRLDKAPLRRPDGRQNQAIRDLANAPLEPIPMPRSK